MPPRANVDGSSLVSLDEFVGFERPTTAVEQIAIQARDNTERSVRLEREDEIRRAEVLDRLLASQQASTSWGVPIMSGTTRVNRALVDRVENVNTRVKKKVKPIIEQLNDISNANKDVFSNVEKLKSEIDNFEESKIKELVEKHDVYLFAMLNNSLSIKGKSEKVIKQYLSIATENLYYTIASYITKSQDILQQEFKSRFENYMAQRIYLDGEAMMVLNSLGDDLYSYYNLIKDKKNELKKLMGNCYSNSSVCEDYLDRDIISRNAHSPRRGDSITVSMGSSRNTGFSGMSTSF